MQAQKLGTYGKKDLGRAQRHRVKASAGSSNCADLGIVTTPFLQLPHSLQAQHTHTDIGRYRKGSVFRLLLRRKRFTKPQQLS